MSIFIFEDISYSKLDISEIKGITSFFSLYLIDRPKKPSLCSNFSLDTMSNLTGVIPSSIADFFEAGESSILKEENFIFPLEYLE